MTVTEIIMKRTGMNAADAAFYAELAGERITSYLGLTPPADLTPYKFSQADLAVLYWQRDTATQQSASALGYKSQSFSEGGVSVSQSGAEGGAIQSDYDAAIAEVLAGLTGPVGVVRFI